MCSWLLRWEKHWYVNMKSGEFKVAFYDGFGSYYLASQTACLLPTTGTATQMANMTYIIEQAIPRVTTGQLDDIFAGIFEEATNLLQQGKDETTTFKDDPISFIASLQGRPTLHTWAHSFTPDLFISLFLVLRAARQTWYERPLPPFAIEKHRKVARAIDAFNAVDAINWGELGVVQWLIRGGLKCSAQRAGNTSMDVDGDGKNKGGESDSDDDGLFVKQTVPGPDLDNVDGMDIDGEVAGPSTQGPVSSGNALSLNTALQAITAQGPGCGDHAQSSHES